MAAQKVGSFLNGSLAVSSNLQRFLAQADLLRGKVVLDIGSGEGGLAQRCLDLDAHCVCGIDISEEAVANASKAVPRAHFAYMNCTDGSAALEFVRSKAPGRELEVALCNAAQIPLPEPLSNGYFVGKDGRDMINEVIKFASTGLPKGGILLMGHTILSDWNKTIALCSEHNLKAEIIEGSSHEFPLYEDINTEKTRAHLQQVCGFDAARGDLVRGCLLRVEHEDAEAEREAKKQKTG
jgi:release factor glutamine methyltransferase